MRKETPSHCNLLHAKNLENQQDARCAKVIIALQSPPAMNTENSTFEPFNNPTTWLMCILYHSPKFSEFPEIHSTKNKQMAQTPQQYINPYLNLDKVLIVFHQPGG